MKSIICAVLLLVAVAVADEDNDNWPCYMKKCGRKAENMEECLIHHANRALSSVLQGDPTIGIPVYNEYDLGSVSFGQNETFKVNMDDTKIYGIEHIHVSGFKWNFEKKTVDLKIYFNSAITVSGAYRSSGNFKGRDMTGAGHLDLICVGGSYGGNFTYNMSYELLKILGKDYVQIKDRVCTRTEGFRINFSNLLKTKQQAASDVAFFNQHSVEANKALNPVLQELVCVLIDQSFNAVFYNFPMDIMFDEN